MEEAVVVATARTPIGRAYRGAFNDTEAPVLGGHVIRAALAKAGVDGGEVDDVVLGIAAQQGTQGYNLGRLCTYTAGLPDTVGGMTIDRMCASGLAAIASAAKSIMAGEHRIAVAELGGVRVGSVYVPNGGKDVTAKLAFLDAMVGWAGEHEAAGTPLVLAGDFNATPDADRPNTTTGARNPGQRACGTATPSPRFVGRSRSRWSGMVPTAPSCRNCWGCARAGRCIG